MTRQKFSVGDNVEFHSEYPFSVLTGTVIEVGVWDKADIFGWLRAGTMFSKISWNDGTETFVPDFTERCQLTCK